VKKEYSLMLGERTAEEIKMAIGSAFPSPDEPHAEIRGRDLVSGCRRRSSSAPRRSARPSRSPSTPSSTRSRATLDKCPPELSGDVMDRGIVITGGGALLKGMDERLRHETGMPIHVTDRPLDSVAMARASASRSSRRCSRS
jgi:rod shape-determining protein MreB